MTSDALVRVRRCGRRRSRRRRCAARGPGTCGRGERNVAAAAERPRAAARPDVPGDVELVAALGRGLARQGRVPRDRLHRPPRGSGRRPMRDDRAVGLVQEIDRDAAVRRGSAVEVERGLRRAVEQRRDAGRRGRPWRRPPWSCVTRSGLRVAREATPSALTSWTRPLRAPWGTTASTCVASATVAGADTSSAWPLPPVNTTCVTVPSWEPSTRIELPGRAVASDAQPVPARDGRRDRGRGGSADVGAAERGTTGRCRGRRDSNGVQHRPMTMTVQRSARLFPVTGRRGGDSRRARGVLPLPRRDPRSPPSGVACSVGSPAPGALAVRADRIRQSPSGAQLYTHFGEATSPVVPYPVAGRAGASCSRLSHAVKTYVAKPTDRERNWLVVDADRADARPARHPDRRRAARQAQADVHAAHRHGRLRRRRQRREDRGHREQARRQDLLPPLRLSGRPEVAHAQRHARAPARRGHPPRGEGDASPQPPRLASSYQAQGLRRPRPSARGAAAAADGAIES